MGEAAGEEESSAAPAEVSRQAELDEQRCLAEALQAINSSVSASLSATLFPLKWQLIRDRLNRLHAGLADITVSAGDENRCDAFANLLRDVAAAAREARELVPRSQGRHYGGGKLRLRSDLDVLGAALDAHVARLDEVYASGALTRARALVVPRPGAGASRDDVRFYVRDLFARLRVGGGEMRREAAAALSEALRDDERCARVVASDVADGVGALVALLECPDARVQEDALEAVSAIARSDAHRGDLVVGGVIAPVVRVLDAGGAGSEAARESAARVLCRLTENSDNAWAVAAHGGVTALLGLCAAGHGASGGGELVCAACRVLRSLAGVDEIRKYMVADAGAVPVLVSLSQRATHDAARIQAMELLAAIGSGDTSARDAVVQEGAVECLVRALDPSSSSSSSSKVREVSLRAIDALCLSPPKSTGRLLAAGFLDRVLSLLRNGDNTLLQHCALKAAHRLCQVSEEVKKAMGDAGFMPELVSVLGASSKSPEAREMAGESLCALVTVPRNRKRFVQEDRDVARVLQLLGPDEEKEKPAPARRFLLSTVAHLTDSSSGRRKIMSSEHVRNLEKLAEADVPDAKRIVKRLGGSRLRSIFHGIWSL